jgi:tripartite-type tricarboxylate transporter receptor subunit TctC
MRRHSIAGALVALSFILSCASADGESFPERPIRIVVGFAAGGTTDIAARVIAAKMAEELGHPIVVDCRPGASTTIAGDLVAKAEPDGYTLFIAGNANAVNVVAQGRLPFDVVKDFAPVGLAATSPSVLVAGPTQKIDSVAQLIEAAKANPGGVFFASSGNGAVSHIAGELFALKTGTKLTHIAYKGSSQAILDVIGGRVQIMFAPISTALPFIRAGTLKPLATTSRQRLASLPDIATLDELQLPGIDAAIWFGLVAPRGTPQDRLDKLQEALRVTLRDEAVRAQLALQGVEPLPGDAADFTARMSAEIARMRELGMAAFGAR